MRASRGARWKEVSSGQDPLGLAKVSGWIRHCVLALSCYWSRALWPAGENEERAKQLEFTVVSGCAMAVGALQHRNTDSDGRRIGHMNLWSLTLSEYGVDEPT